MFTPGTAPGTSYILDPDPTSGPGSGQSPIMRINANPDTKIGLIDTGTAYFTSTRYPVLRIQIGNLNLFYYAAPDDLFLPPETFIGIASLQSRLLSAHRG